MTRPPPILKFGIPLVLLVWGGYALLYGDQIRGYAFEDAMYPSPIENPAHVDELTAGREVVQPVEWHRLKPIARARKQDNIVCAAFEFATYGGRRNRGTIAIELIGPEVSGEARVDMAAVKDNKFHTVCFAGVRLADVIDQPSFLRIRSLDGELGRSVTAWLSGHEGAARATVDGQQVERTLVYHLRTVAGNTRERIAGWVLILFAGLIMATLVLAAFDRRLR
jgi:hypothetical protein